MLLVAAALIVGLACLRPAGAADPTDDEFKALVEQDAKIIARAADAVGKATGKDKRVVEKNAGSGIKSSALIMAGYANARITGTNADADAKAAGIRDTAIEIFKAADDKKFKEAAEAAKGLASPKPATGAKKIDIAKALGDLTQKEVMDNFKKTSQYGTHVEEDIKTNAEKPTAKPNEAALMAYRVLAMAEYNKTVTKTENAADRKKWDEYNAKMISSTEALLAASKKKSTAAEMKKAFAAVNATCFACHDDFK
jgi:hypothetical protein